MVVWKRIKDVFETRNGYTPSTKNDSFWTGGIIPWFKMDDIRENGSVLNDSNLHITKKAIKGKGLFKANSIILATSATIGEHALITVDHLCNQRFTNFFPQKEFEEMVDMKYVYYYMFKVDEWCKQHTHQGGFASVDMEGLNKLRIPIPSLSEQKRIVGILDTFTDSIENLKQQIAQRRKQYEHYRDQLLDLEGKEGVEMTPLKDVAEIGTGSSNTNEGLKEGKYPFYTRGKEVLWKNEYEFDDTSIITAGDGVGVGKVFHFVSGKYALHQRAYRIHIKSNDIIPRFIYFFMVSTFETYIRMKSFFAAVSSVRKPMIYNYPIPKCPLSEQQRIVSILDTFEASISNLEAQLEQRQKQYEYYRNKLLTFEKEEH